VVVSQPQPYFDTERDFPVDAEGRGPQPATCLLCGLEATTAEVWLKPAWWREPGSDGKQITTIPRCLDVDACRSRVLAAGEAWPLLERGEQPDAKREPAPLTRSAPVPPPLNPALIGDLQKGRLPEPAAPVTPDAEPPKEEDEWI
jgi:hypothetical protein